MTRNISLILCLLIGSCLTSSDQKIDSKVKLEKLEQLSDEFNDPPMSSRPGAFWCWLNGDVTKASITKDLEEMKDKGMARAEIWDVEARNNIGGAFGIGPEFLGDESVELIKHALSEGKRLGMRIGMVASSGWNAGGSWVTPDWAAKALYSSELNITGPQTYSGPLPFPQVPDHCPKDNSGMPIYSKDVAVVAIPNDGNRKIKDLSQVLILNSRFKDNKLKWDVPAGNWTLLRFVCSNTGQHLIVPSPNSDGLFIDFFDPKATKRHLSYILGRLGITKENGKKSGLGYLEFDSMELDEGTPWTDAMDSIFAAHYGYDILPYMPVFAGWELPDGNDRFLYDFKKTVSNQLIYSHYTTGRDFLAEYGIDLVGEAGGPGPPVWNSCPVDALKALGNVTIPRGEFWIQNRHNIFLVKEVASASHTYGLNIVDAESWTTWRRWKDAPHALKKHVDRAFCEGLNCVTIHTFANTRPEFGLPGRAYHAGIDINSTATWWEQAKPFMDYLSRCSHLLSQGKFVADVAYYYGDKAPNFFPELQKDPNRPRLDDLDPGYDFDVINTDVILNRLEVSKGKLILPDGMNYKLLVLPNIKDIPDEVVEKVMRLVDAGAKVLIQNPDLAKKYNGGFLSNMSIDGALTKLAIIKDFKGDPQKLDFIHRRVDGADYYYVTNTTDQPISEDCEFRVTNKNVEFWDPVSSRQFQMTKAVSMKDKTQINLQLPPHGSGFVVFSDIPRDLPPDEKVVKPQLTGINGPWMLSFPENWGAPPSVLLDTLISWTDHPEEGIKYFSGTATYTNNLQISKNDLESEQELLLNLGEVLDVAEVVVNDKSAGVLWTKPYELDIRDFVKEGSNKVEIKITNMWINRLTGDMDLPEDEKFCRTNRPYITKDYSAIGDETYRVQPAGLLGPVVLSTAVD